jgi:uncharacterized protein
VRAFFDTSALVKRYLDEPGSETVSAILEAAEALIVSVICLPECVSALQRMVREGYLSSQEYARLKDGMLTDLGDAIVCHVVPEVVDGAVECLERYPLRTLDALQIASARAVNADLLVTADRRQSDAARGEGLEVRLV